MFVFLFSSKIHSIFPIFSPSKLHFFSSSHLIKYIYISSFFSPVPAHSYRRCPPPSNNVVIAAIFKNHNIFLHFPYLQPATPLPLFPLSLTFSPFFLHPNMFFFFSYDLIIYIYIYCCKIIN